MELFGLIKKVREEDDRPKDLIKTFFSHYYPLMMKKYDDYDKRLSDIESLEQIAFRYDSLGEFLTDIALEPPEKSVLDARHKYNDSKQLVLSTIHSAKGLEWHTVFIIFLAEGYLPSYRSLENEDYVEEERRLFYVAVTRAKENLYLTVPRVGPIRSYQHQRHSSFMRVSRFLNEGDILNRYVKIENFDFNPFPQKKKYHFRDPYIDDDPYDRIDSYGHNPYDRHRSW